MVRSRACALYAVLGVALAGCHRTHGPRVFVTNEDDGTNTVIDARSLDVIDTIHVGQRPRGVRISKDDKWLYVALSGSAKAGPGAAEAPPLPPNRAADGIGVIDLGDWSLARVLPSGPDPKSFDLAGDHMLIVSNEETAEASIVNLDRRKLAGRVVRRIHAGGSPWGVAITR